MADLEQALANEIKEFHFHVYFMQNQSKSVQEAEALHKKIQDLVAAGFFHVVPGKIYYQPFKPHLVANFEIWVPKEHFARAYQWIVLNRGTLSVMIHPLTRLEIKDHTERAVWLGPSFPLDMSWLTEEFPAPEIQFPELKMGYSAPPEKK